jgi:TolB-like protein
MNRELSLDELSSFENNVSSRSAKKARADIDFAAAVRHALKYYYRPDRLGENPLLSSRVVLARLDGDSPPPTPIQALQAVLRAHCDKLAETPNVAAPARTLELTYFKPVRCRKAAAESLHLSWSTYRRRVASAIQLLAAQLWQTELALARAATEDPAAPADCPTAIGPDAPLPPPVVSPKKRHTRGALATLILAGVCAALWLLFPLGSEPGASPLKPAAHTDKPTLAMLPLLNINENRPTRHLSDRIAVELINRFERLGKLRVAARTSSFAFRDSLMDAQKIGRALGVGNILEGSIRKTASGVRIRVALVNTHDGYERWSHEYNVRSSNLPKIENTIVEAVAKKLHLDPSKAPSADPPAQAAR